MSNKMRKFLNKEPKRMVYVKESRQKIPSELNLLNESVIIDNDDKEAIYHYIQQPGNQQYTLKTYSDTYPEEDRTIIFSRTMGTGNRTVVILYSALEEISNFIVEMCDEMGWQFVSTLQNEPEKIIFQIFVRF
jgi:hypothetical protein